MTIQATLKLERGDKIHVGFNGYLNEVGFQIGE